MSSPSSVITLGYGSFGSVNLLPTLGYGNSSAAALVYGPLRIAACEVYIPGAHAVEPYIPGPQVVEPQIHGAHAIEVQI